MLLLAVVLADFIWLAAVVTALPASSGKWDPIGQAAQRIDELVSTIKPDDAWAFLAVFATIVVAIQVAGSTNQQRRNTVADLRAARFTFAALATGAITLLAGVSFILSFAPTEPGKVTLMIAAVCAVTFFAADGASLVLRADRRTEVLENIRERIRSDRGLRRSDRQAVRVVARSVLALAVWSLTASWVSVAAVLLAASAIAGASLGANWGFLLPMSVLALTMTGLASLFVFGTWAAMRAQPGQRAPYIAVAGICAAIAVWSLASLLVGVLQARQSGWATAVLAAAVVVPLCVPLTAFIGGREKVDTGRQHP